MKMAAPSERDIDAAGNLMSLLYQIDRGDYPNLDENAEVPDWFDEDNYEHLRAFYDAVKGTLDKAPGYPGRVIGGMCYVIMYDKNEIVDLTSDTLDLHPKIIKALAAAEAAPMASTDAVIEARKQALEDALKAAQQCYVRPMVPDDPDPDAEIHNGGVANCVERIRALKSRTKAADAQGADK